MEKKSDVGKQSLSGDYVMVGKQDVSTIQGTLFIEARIRDDVVRDPQLEISVTKVRDVIVRLSLRTM
jgi:pachytene checkpoint protein 2